jgi:putative pyoverdin transport system ATP-binding/permease protein
MLLRRSSGLAWLGALISLGAGALTALVVIGTQRLFTRPDDPPSIWLLLVGLVGMLGTSMLAQTSIQALSGRALRDLQVELAARMIAAPLRKLEIVGPARLLAVQLGDAQSISGGIFVIPLLLSNSVVLLACLGFLASRSGILIAVLLSVIVLLFLTVVLISAAARRRDRLARIQSDELIGHVRYTTEGAKELKMSRARRESFLSDDLKVSAEKQERVFFAASTLHVLSSNVGRVLIFLAIIAVAIAGARAKIPHQEVQTFGFVVLYAAGPLAVLLGNAPAVLRALVALETIRALGFELSAEAAPTHTERPVTPSPAKLVGVSHSYSREDGSQFVLGPLDFEVRPGELVFVVGGNGTGKSTLVKLLTGLYTPETGEIRLGDDVIGDELAAWYREHFSTVFYDYALPSEVPLAKDAEFDELLSGVGLQHLRQRGERVRPAELSTGQRRRLALVFALRESRPLYVFDEWASDQDPEFKEHFYKTVLQKLRAAGKGIVVVSHDDRYYDTADRVVRLENGQVQTTKSPRTVPAGSETAALRTS